MQKKILLIDDEPLIRKVAKLSLGSRGYDVHTAISGNDGLMKVDILQPDLILLDIVMNDMDGWQVLYTLKNDPCTKNIPVIVLTSLDYLVAKRKASEMNAAAVLNKPFHVDALLRIVEKIFDPVCSSE